MPKAVDTRCAVESLICLRETRRRDADGTEVAYLALAYNERGPKTGTPKARVVHNFGRVDLVGRGDREGLCRLVCLISCFFDPAGAVAATACGVVSVIDARPMGSKRSPTTPATGRWTSSWAPAASCKSRSSSRSPTC